MAHILIVEDNELNRDMLEPSAGARGLNKPRRLTAGRRGQSLLLAADLVLMDMDLPIIDGWEATRQCKNNEATKHIPVIALTAHALAEHASRPRKPADDFDTKPLTCRACSTKSTRFCLAAPKKAVSPY